MGIGKLAGDRIARAKRAFTTRRVRPSAMKTLITGDVTPASGDLVLARMEEIGHHAKLELTDGRRAQMFPGDEIVVCFGNRYAPDQFEATIGIDLSPCDLVAAGGIAAVELARHQRMRAPTRIRPLGLIGDGKGERLNVMRFRVAGGDEFPPIPAILSLGTSMNSGKTLTATSLVRGFKGLGYRVAALKITGTGAGGDMWIVRDAGADVVLDFTDAGFASTYLTPLSDIETGTFRLLNHAVQKGCDVAVIEIADGLQQLETAGLIRSDAMREIAVGCVFAAYDSMGAKHGVDVLRELGHSVLALSGRVGRSPLGVREAEAATNLRVYSPWELQDGALVPAIRQRAAEAYLSSGCRRTHLQRLAKAFGPASGRRKGTPAPANGSGLVQFTGDPPLDRPRRLLRLIADHVMAREIELRCGAGLGERSSGRIDRRNGYRAQVWQSPVGNIELRVPRLRRKNYQPHFLRRTALGPDEVDISLQALGTPAFGPAFERVLQGMEASDMGQVDRLRLEAEIKSSFAATAEANDARRGAVSGAGFERPIQIEEGDPLMLADNEEMEVEEFANALRRDPLPQEPKVDFGEDDVSFPSVYRTQRSIGAE